MICIIIIISEKKYNDMYIIIFNIIYLFILFINIIIILIINTILFYLSILYLINLHFPSKKYKKYNFNGIKSTVVTIIKI